jgi:hypothetical protein
MVHLDPSNALPLHLKHNTNNNYFFFFNGKYNYIYITRKYDTPNRI